MHITSNHITDIRTLLEQAAGEIMRFFNEQNYATTTKSDFSPVTEADMLSHQIITEGLAKLFPNIPVISEEDPSNHEAARQQDLFWLLDPLDGTESFVKHSENFTINLALINQKLPEFGMIYHPIAKTCYYNEGSKVIATSPAGDKLYYQEDDSGYNQKMVIGGHYKPHHPFYQKIQDRLEVASVSQLHSALKFCRLIEGDYALYPRTRPAMEWDIAAGHALLRSIGGEVFDLEGTIYNYGHEGFLVNGFLAVRAIATAERVFKRK